MARTATGLLLTIIAGVTGFVLGACLFVALFGLPLWSVVLGAVAVTTGGAYHSVKLGATRLSVAWFGAVIWLVALGMVVVAANGYGN